MKTFIEGELRLRAERLPPYAFGLNPPGDLFSRLKRRARRDATPKGSQPGGCRSGCCSHAR